MRVSFHVLVTALAAGLALARGAAAGDSEDLDRDGQLDLVLRNYRQPAQLLANRGGTNRCLQLVLVGTRSNRDAIGAVVRLHTPAGWQTRAVSAGSGFLSTQSLVQHVGLGTADAADAVEITWPSGARTMLGRLAVGRCRTVVEGVDDVVRN